MLGQDWNLHCPRCKQTHIVKASSRDVSCPNCGHQIRVAYRDHTKAVKEHLDSDRKANANGLKALKRDDDERHVEPKVRT